jgi:hypothetical protein
MVRPVQPLVDRLGRAMGGPARVPRSRAVRLCWLCATGSPGPPGNGSPKDAVVEGVLAEIDLGSLVAGFVFLLAAGGLVVVNLIGAKDGLRESRRRSARPAA